MRELETLSVVALLEDLADKGLLRGQVGTIVERLAAGVYEVEFSDDEGQTYAALLLRSDQLLQLHHEPSHQPKNGSWKPVLSLTLVPASA
jgi:hypothetical protein